MIFPGVYLRNIAWLLDIFEMLDVPKLIDNPLFHICVHHFAIAKLGQPRR